jgi:dienelactone hydrolase
MLIGILCTGLSAASAQAALKTEEITYTDGRTEMKGYLAWDDAIEGARPGVLVVHEWWGLNAYARKRAEQLAGMGYAALAVDMYGDGKTTEHPAEAGEFASAVFTDLDAATARFRAARNTLAGHAVTDPDRIAAIGYCFGGGVVLHMARFGVDLRGVASFHGSLATQRPAQPGEVKAKVLVCNGADDPMVTAEQIRDFTREMDSAGVNYKFINYPGAVHSFTNPGATAVGEKLDMPLRYNQAADEASWQELQRFLQEIFATAPAATE